MKDKREAINNSEKYCLDSKIIYS